jgi:hydrogenase maturation protease
MLRAQTLPESIEVVDGGTRGLDLVNLMEGWPRVILIDAANLDKEPGQFARFTLDEVRLLGDDDPLSIHGTGLREALLLAQVLGVLPEQVVIYGVQPAHLDWRDELSPEIEAALPELVAALLNEISGS